MIEFTRLCERRPGGIVFEPGAEQRLESSPENQWELIKKDYFREGSSIMVIHTGGLQGIEGMNERTKNKDLQIL